jgi:putative addiction module component (TIGR02574 family)
MSPRAFDVVRQDALALSDLDRAELARDLVASLDGPADPDAGAAWDKELCRRIDSVEAGKAKLLDPTEVLNRAKSRLKGD